MTTMADLVFKRNKKAVIEAPSVLEAEIVTPKATPAKSSTGGNRGYAIFGLAVVVIFIIIMGYFWYRGCPPWNGWLSCASNIMGFSLPKL